MCHLRIANTRHSKNYNHDDKRKVNNIYLCEFCHIALHLLNNRNSLDWYYMQTKLKEIVRLGNVLYKKRVTSSAVGKKLKGGKK